MLSGLSCPGCSFADVFLWHLRVLENTAVVFPFGVRACAQKQADKLYVTVEELSNSYTNICSKIRGSCVL